MLDRMTKAILGLLTVAALGFAQDAPKKKAVKDQGEYDIFTSVSKETDLNKKLVLLGTWKEKYPDSDYKNERMLTELDTYTKIAGGTMGKQPTPESLSAGEKAANTIIANLDTYFVSSAKPDNVSDADWTKLRADTEATAHLTLGWIAMQNKEFPKAEQEFTKVLTLNGNNAQASYFLGTVIALQRKIERQPEALYQFARAAAVTGPGALPPEAKKTTEEYLAKAYKSYHGSPEGLDQLKQQASGSALPPAGFTIESINDIEKKKFANEEEYNKAHPDIALWRSLKNELTGAEGQAYFEKNLKGADVPGGAGSVKQFSGKVVSAAGKDVVVAVDNAAGDATLRFETPLRGKVEVGTDVQFDGVPESFTKEPYMITFAVDKTKVKGLGAAAAGGAARAPARRPAARKKR